MDLLKEHSNNVSLDCKTESQSVKLERELVVDRLALLYLILLQDTHPQTLSRNNKHCLSSLQPSKHHALFSQRYCQLSLQYMYVPRWLICAMFSSFSLHFFCTKVCFSEKIEEWKSLISVEVCWPLPSQLVEFRSSQNFFSSPYITLTSCASSTSEDNPVLRFLPSRKRLSEQ